MSRLLIPILLAVLPWPGWGASRASAQELPIPPATGALMGAAPDAAWPIDPPWATRVPRHDVSMDWEADQDALGNGARLAAAVAALRPGDRLLLGAGTWTLSKRFVIDLVGSAEAPIFIEAKPNEHPVITRLDDRQNVVDVGAGGPHTARYLAIRGLEFRGGSAGVRLHGCDHVWFDRNEIHHTGGGGLTANTQNTTFLFITRNHIHHTSGYGEGMYLGANNGAVAMSSSVVAFNHVHHCGGRQGDGIELKQGSYANRIVGNTVHDTGYPAILVYGTGGKPPNLVERNWCWGSRGNVMQVQGEAIVRNNLIMGGAIGFHSHDHQGQTRDLIFVHNTIVTSGVGADLFSWNDRPGMVFANNAVYALAGPAIRCEQGAVGVTLAGNVVFGSVEGAPSSGWSAGHGLMDFEHAAWDGSWRDLRPSAGSPLIDGGDRRFAQWGDLLGHERGDRVDAGCVERL